MYQNEEMFKNMLALLANPMFRTGFFEFANKAQQDGMEAAKKFWSLSDYGKAFPYSQDMYERLADWYKAMGFVPSVKYNEVVNENAALKAENQMLKNTIKDLQFNLLSEGGEKAQQAWHDIIDKQIQMNTQVANSFFETIRQLKPSS